MPTVFTNQYHLPYHFKQVAQSLFQKYPNPQAPHVFSVDTLSATIDETDGTLRVERLLGVRQNAPRWVMKLMSGQEETYVREITFVRLPSPLNDENGKPPAVLQASQNLSLNHIVKCDERISYIPSDSLTMAPTTFNQSAVFKAQGKLKPGEVAAYLGKKVEKNSWDRFDQNAHIGQLGFMHVLERMWGGSESQNASL